MARPLGGSAKNRQKEQHFHTELGFDISFPSAVENELISNYDFVCSSEQYSLFEKWITVLWSTWSIKSINYYSAEFHIILHAVAEIGI